MNHHLAASSSCPVCRDSVRNRDFVVCGDCASPIHRSCWASNGKTPLHACSAFQVRSSSVARPLGAIPITACEPIAIGSEKKDKAETFAAVLARRQKVLTELAGEMKAELGELTLGPRVYFIAANVIFLLWMIAQHTIGRSHVPLLHFWTISVAVPFVMLHLGPLLGFENKLVSMNRRIQYAEAELTGIQRFLRTKRPAKPALVKLHNTRA
jgi:hypothetical protein